MRKFFIDHNSKTINAIKKINQLGGQSLIVVAKKVKLKGCRGCADIKEIFRIKYCGRKCQKKDWQRHSTICKRKGKEKYAPK